MNEARDLYEGISVDYEPSEKAPEPRWCPNCKATIIEQYQALCLDCEDALQSEDE